mgnify:CR=1 FL=1
MVVAQVGGKQEISLQGNLVAEYWVVDGRLHGKERNVDTTTTVESRELQNVSARIHHMDQLNIDIQVLYPSLFLRPYTSNAEIEYALCKSYNRWLASINAQAPERLRWVVCPPLLSMDRVREELAFGKEHGACGIFVRAFETNRLLTDHKLFPLYALAEEFDLAIQFDPGNSDAYRKKGLVKFGLKQYEEAEKLFKKVISLDPENVQAYINLGMVKYTTGNKVDAKKLWEKSIDIKKDDDDSKAINNIANLYKEEKNYDKAIEYYRLAINNSPKNSMYMNNLADTFRLNSELDQALEVLQDSLKLNPAGMGTYFNLGMVYKDLKENKKAINSFEKSLQTNFSLTEAYYQIAQIHLTVKNHDAALKSIENAIKFSPTNQTYQKFQEKIIASQTK